MANEVIGHWRCDAGGQADVMQTKRRGHHLYTNCACCGLDQRTGAKRQTQLWNEAKFFAGAKLEKPSNVQYLTEDGTEGGDQPQPTQTEREPEGEPDFDPGEPEPETEPEPTPGRSWPRLIAGVTLIGSAIGGWVWTRKP
ncbi:hypothetical protein [Marinimicrobium agarilyticum]|uniref:hypothetical protein n=1 Tax=Marinimicrobium agarilyticum TaxID=306546 RepID=UPI000485E7C5|nr:hypothetical protein [Marinimicrobium agarilyticum]